MTVDLCSTITGEEKAGKNRGDDTVRGGSEQGCK